MWKRFTVDDSFLLTANDRHAIGLSSSKLVFLIFLLKNIFGVLSNFLSSFRFFFSIFHLQLLSDVTPTGAISFISHLYGGSVSDNELANCWTNYRKVIR